MRTPAFIITALFLATDALAAQRVFVASYGNDTSACTLAAPCRAFARAMTQVDAGGEVVALDTAGYGPVEIDKSVTITSNPGFFAGISASSGVAVSVVASGARVVLRGLDIKGTGGQLGIQMSVPGSLTVENCIVSNFSSHGMMVNHQVAVRMVDTTVQGNGNFGIMMSTGLGGTLH